MMAKIDKVKAKRMVGETATRTVRFTIKIVKLIFILIIAYTALVTIWIYLNSDPETFFTNIATISVGGFWAFFLGYFGWRLGQSIEVYFYDLKGKNKN